MSIFQTFFLLSVFFGNLAGQNVLQLSGLRNGYPEVSRRFRNTKIRLRVLGRNLPSDGYFFTTATRCQDYYLTNVSSVSTVFAKTEKTFCSSAVISVPNGLPFNVPNKAYHLCNLKGTVEREDYVQILLNESEHRILSGNTFLLCILCILLSAYSSGMTLGYMKFSIVELNRMINTGEPNLQRRARRILSFRRRSNWLVVAFSLFSSIFTVLFTTTVESMLDGSPNEEVWKIVVPTLILFIFAEMLPQAICNSKFGFNLASGLWFISVLIFIVTFPIAYPASLVLGRFLKRNVREVLTQEEKTCMVRNLAKNANEREKTILENATTFSLKKVEDLMVPIEQVFLLSRSQRLNRSTILTLVEKGYTRVPVCDEKNKDAIVAMLNLKDLNLVTCDLSKEPTVKDVLKRIGKIKQKKQSEAQYVNSEMNAHLLLNKMRTGDFHFACVVRYTPFMSKVVGIITIEDILEELFGKIDEINEKRVRSSVDDRADNAVIGWCREAGTDKNYPLLFSQQLRILQCVRNECYVFKKLGIEILKLKQLLSSDKIKTARIGEEIATSNVFVVIWKGIIRVEGRGEKDSDMISFEQEVTVPPIRTEKEKEADRWKRTFEKTTPRTEWEIQNNRNSVPAFIIGKSVLNKMVEILSCPFTEPNTDNYDMCVAVSETVSYFELKVEDLLYSINGGGAVKKHESRTNESFMSRISNPNTPITKSPLPSPNLPKQGDVEKVPLLGKPK